MRKPLSLRRPATHLTSTTRARRRATKHWVVVWKFVAVEEYTKSDKTVQIFSLDTVHELLERRFRKGVRLDDKALLGMRMRPRLDETHAVRS